MAAVLHENMKNSVHQITTTNVIPMRKCWLQSVKRQMVDRVSFYTSDYASNLSSLQEEQESNIPH